MRERVSERVPLLREQFSEQDLNLVDLGEEMGADPSSWSNEAPVF